MFASPAGGVIEGMTLSQMRAVATATNLFPGFQLGHYLVQDLVHQDATEEVYRARDTRIDRDVLLKLAQSPIGSDHFVRFLQKWRTGALFCHPNVLAVYDFGWHEGRPFMVSEVLEGGTLRSLVNAGPIMPGTAARLAMQIADGLNAAHRAGVVHGDLTPENIFITPRGDVKILNFSPARYLDERLELVQQSARSSAPRAIPALSVAYMSPEQASAGSIDHRTDIFSLGVMLYEMVTGVVPFLRSSPIETLVAIVEDGLPDLRDDEPSVCQVVDRVVRRCVEKDPAERFQSALGLLFKLELLQPSLHAASETRGRLTASDELMTRVRGLFRSREAS
jgi:serine/threonine protein kinase